MKRFFTIIVLVTMSLIVFTACETPIGGNEKEQNMHEYVDLGLSVKWATCNVGAESPEEYGDYFAWGEVEPKEYYDFSTYKHVIDGDRLIKYYYFDSISELEPEDDAAIVNWGGAWRMPTLEEQKELIDDCTWEWTTQNGVDGHKVTGPNGNSIFLPAAGYMDGSTLRDAGSGCDYWSSTLSSDYPYNAYSIYFVSQFVFWDWGARDLGHSVRPVCE